MSSALQWRPVLLLLAFSVVWGSNMGVVKLTSADLAPCFMAAARSAIATVCMLIWMRSRGIPVWPRGMMLFHAVVAGVLFGGEFGLIFVGLQFTAASRVYVLVYTAPFFVAIMAHFFLKGDRLNTRKMVGLIMAFGGVVILFWKDMASLNTATLPGDIMGLIAGFMWGVSTVYIKRYIAGRARPVQTLFYQLLFSIPLLMGVSLALEETMITAFTGYDALSLAFQGVVVACLSYLAWFHLIHNHPVSLIHAFSFFTPVMGVFISGVLILGEPLRFSLAAALALVSLGLFLVNREGNGGRRRV